MAEDRRRATLRVILNFNKYLFIYYLVNISTTVLFSTEYFKF